MTPLRYPRAGRLNGRYGANDFLLGIAEPIRTPDPVEVPAQPFQNALPQTISITCRP